MLKLESEQQFEELKQNNCKVIEPELPQLEEKYSSFKFVSVDRDQFIDICIDNGIMGIPSFLVYRNGELLGSYISKERKSIEQIDTFLSQYI